MYTILVNHDNELIATQKQAIMQYSKLVDELRFLVPPDYGDLDMSEFNSVILEYISPVGKVYRTENLTLQEERYKEHLVYILPVNTKLTAEAGEIELQITFTKVELNPDNGQPFERVRKTKPCKINVFPIANWSQFIADEALTALDQRIVQMQAAQEAMNEAQQQIIEWQDSIIDDENISTETTYSSSMIEKKFLDGQELDNAIEDSVGAVVDETIDEKLQTLDDRQRISEEEIGDLFN